jgi:hypothetical protein
LSGVLAVLAYLNAPPMVDTKDQELSVLQSAAVGFRGPFIAAVVAESSEIARHAASMEVHNAPRNSTCRWSAQRLFLRTPRMWRQYLPHRIGRPRSLRLPGDRRRIPNGCWSTAHLPTGISKLPADRSVNYLVDEVDDSSSWAFVADAPSWCSTNQPARTLLPAPRWRVMHWSARGDGRLVPASRVAWVGAAATRDSGESGAEAVLVAGDERAAERGVEELGCWSRSSRICSDSLAVALGEHSSCGPDQPQVPKPATEQIGRVPS